MSKKVANASKQPVAIRLVKRASASVGFSDGIKPAGAIDDGVELSFNLGPYTPDQGRFVIGSSITPNIKNPQTYVDIGEEFKISEIDGNVFIEGDLTTNETDPNYTTLTFGVFFRLKKTDGLYVMASERPTHTVVNYKNVKTQVEKVAIKQSVGQYFNDDNYYIPLYLGTVKELLAHWADTTAMGLPDLKALGHRVIGNKVALTVDLPLESVAITNTGDFVIGQTVAITHQHTPAIAKIVNTEYSVDDTTIAEFTPGTNQLVIKSMGAVNVTVSLTDNIGNVMSTSKAFNAILDYAPLIAKYDVNNSAVHLDITPTATTKGFVDWGDGTVEALSTNVTHQYVGASKPTVKLWVDGGLDVANIAADNTLVEVVQWGDKAIKHPQVGSSKLVKVPTVAPLGLTSTVSTFEGATLFNQNLNGWDMSGVTSVEGMFAGASSFNGLVDTWNVSKVKRFTRMFDGAASFDSSVNAWNVSAGESFANMFTNASTFNQPIDQWRPTGAGQVSASLMFSGAVTFNSSVAGFFTGAVNDCTEMFAGCSSFNQDLSGVKLSTPLIADGMFKDCITFNKPVGNLNGVDLIGVAGMFEGCRSFNQNLMGLKFKTPNLNSLLAGCSAFNQPLNDLDVSNVTSMDYLFDGCTAFTSDLSAWDVSSLESATAMLRNTSNFDSDLNWWCVSNITTEPENFATGSFLASSNYPLWGTCPVRDVVIDIDNKNQFLMLGDNGVMTYTANKPFDEVSVVWLSSNPDAISINAATGEYAVVGLGGASISVKVNDLYSARRDYLTIQEYTPATFKANGDSVTIQLVANSSRAGEAYVDWGDGVYEQVTTVNPLTHTYKDTTERLISVMPMSPLGSSIDVNGPAITSIEQFGECDVTITSRDLVAVPTTLPTTLTKVAFVNCPNLNDPNIANWDVTNITNFSRMFAGCSSFNQDISGWDVADATNLAFMFENATVFNQDISGWGVGNVVNMEGMFFGAAAFNQPIGKWSVSKVTNMVDTFNGAAAFNQDLTLWCVTDITTKPTNFDLNSGLVEDQLPGWGTCPSRTAVLTLNGALASMAVGSKTQLTVTLREGVTEVPVTSTKWSVSDAEKATITEAGLLTITAEGDFTVQAVANRAYKANANVNAVIPTVEIVGATTGEVGENITLRYNVNPTYTPETVVWSSSDETKATVNATTGVVTLLEVGDVTFTVTLDGANTGTHAFSVIPATVQFVGKTVAGTFGLSIPKDTAIVTINNVDLTPTAVTETHDTWDMTVEADQTLVIVPADATSPLGALTFSSGLGEVVTWSSYGHVADEDYGMSPVILGADIVAVPDQLPTEITTLNGMFENASNFNDPSVINWDVSKVETMYRAFYNASSFNQDISGWDVSTVNSMAEMFSGATLFNQNLTPWCVTNITEVPENFASGSGILPDQYPSWGYCPLPADQISRVLQLTLQEGDLSVGVEANDGTGKPWYLYNGAGQIVTAGTGVKEVTGLAEGQHVLYVATETLNGFDATTNVHCKGTALTTLFEQTQATINRGHYSSRLVPSPNLTTASIAVERYASASLADFFFGCTNLNSLSAMFANEAVTDVSSFFEGCSSLASGYTWEMPNLTNVSQLYKGCTSMESALDRFDATSKITNFKGMYEGCTALTDISLLDPDIVQNATDMSAMFNGCTALVGDISLWCVPLISEAPVDFATGSSLTLPVWGTCPSAVVTITEPMNIVMGETLTAQFTTVPVMSRNDVTWELATGDVATVDPTTGVITPVAPGEDIITVTINGVNTDIATVTVTASA